MLNLLNEASDSKFVTRKWNIVNDQLNWNYAVGNKVIYNRKVLKSNHCGFDDVYILVTGDITVIATPAAQLSFQNYAPFTDNHRN